VNNKFAAIHGGRRDEAVRAERYRRFDAREQKRWLREQELSGCDWPDGSSLFVGLVWRALGIIAIGAIALYALWGHIPYA